MPVIPPPDFPEIAPPAPQTQAIPGIREREFGIGERGSTQAVGDMVAVPRRLLEWAQQNIDCEEDTDERDEVSAALAQYIAAPCINARDTLTDEELADPVLVRHYIDACHDSFDTAMAEIARLRALVPPPREVKAWRVDLLMTVAGGDEVVYKTKFFRRLNDAILSIGQWPAQIGPGWETWEMRTVITELFAGAPGAPVRADTETLNNWLDMIHDNGYALGDRLQRLSCAIALLLDGKPAPRHIIREQSLMDAALLSEKISVPQELP